MKSGRSWGLFVVASFVAVGGCATSPAFDGSLGDDGVDSGSSSGDDADNTPALDAAHHSDSATHDAPSSNADSSSGNDSSSSPDTSTSIDSGTPDTSVSLDTGAPDTATTGCSPQSVSGFTPTYTQPVAKSIKCTTTQTNNIYAGCLAANATMATCQTAYNAAPTCYNCIFTPSTAASWGAVIEMTNGTVRVNLAGCVQNSDSTQTTCAHSLAAHEGCDEAACEAACPVTDQMSLDAYNACFTSADSGGCATYATTANNCQAAIPSSSAAYRCFQGATFQALYQNVVPAFCGP
jgi:hypothetical protein